MGGLGNVLFQLNFAHRLRLAGFNVCINCSLIKNTLLTQKVLRWSDHNTYNDLIKLNLLDSYQISDSLSLDYASAFLSRKFNSSILGTTFYGHDAPHVDDFLSSSIFGYFHLDNPISAGFVSILRASLLSLLETAQFCYIPKILNEIDDGMVVHIRGGDYISVPAFQINSEYYKKALDGYSDCVVVTNDRDFAGDLLSTVNIKYHFVNTLGTVDDFIVLAHSKRKVLANSTFSWWAAEVGDEGAVVIQKEPFFSHLQWNPKTAIKRTLLHNFD
jgi:hypothetical protein